MKSNITVLVDIDGVLADLQNHFIDWVIELGYEYDLAKCDDYALHTGLLVKDSEAVMHEVFNDEDFWYSAPTIENSYEGLFYLTKSFDTYIATSPWNSQNEVTKTAWIERHYKFFNPDRILFSHKKWLLTSDIIIEDKPDTIERCNKAGIKTICKLQPYNLDTNPTAFLFNWKDIYDTMECILKEDL